MSRPCPVAAQVEHDRREPRADPQLPDALGVVRGERPVGADERVLGDLLGVVGVAGHPQGDRVAAVHVGVDQGLERPVEIPGEAVSELGVVHHLPEPGSMRPVARGAPGRWRRPDPSTRIATDRGSPARRSPPIPACHNADMLLDDRFDDLVASLGGFYRTWYVVTGLELGLFARLREAGAGRADRGRAGAADRHRARPGRPLGLGRRRARPRRARRRPAPDPRGRGGHPARRGPARVPRRPVPPRGDRQPRLRGPARGVPDRRSRGVAARPLPAGHRAADRPGHRRVLPGGAAGDPAARRRPPARLPDPRHPLRRRPLADRDGPPLPGHDAHRRSSSSRTP